MLMLKIIGLCVTVGFINIASRRTPSDKKQIVRALDFIERFHHNDYKVKFERVELVNFTKQYMRNFRIVTYKYNRTCAVINMTWTYAVDVGYDYYAEVQFYRFASNEYRLFPLRVQLNACDAIKKNAVGLAGLTRCGNFSGCPIVKDQQVVVCKWQPDPDHFPPFLPDDQYMMDLRGLFRSQEMYLARAYGIVFRPIVKNDLSVN